MLLELEINMATETWWEVSLYSENAQNIKANTLRILAGLQRRDVWE